MKQTDKKAAEIKVRKQRAKRMAFICFVLDALDKKGSWCGIQHIQKACYVAQEILGVPLKYEFVSYTSDSPHSFEIPDDTDNAIGTAVLRTECRHPFYAFSYLLGRNIIEYVEDNRESYKYAAEVKFIADWFGDRSARELEELTSAHMSRQELGAKASTKAIVDDVIAGNPYLDEQNIKRALAEVKVKEKEALKVFPALAKRTEKAKARLAKKPLAKPPKQVHRDFAKAA